MTNSDKRRAAAIVLRSLRQWRDRARRTTPEEFHVGCRDLVGCGRYLAQAANERDTAARDLRSQLASAAICRRPSRGAA